MRALRFVFLATAALVAGLSLAPSAAEARGYWYGEHGYYRPPPPRFYAPPPPPPVSTTGRRLRRITPHPRRPSRTAPRLLRPPAALLRTAPAPLRLVSHPRP